MDSNLKRFYRNPKISINLPSGGKFYKENEVKLSIDGTLPVRAMTGRDEMMLKSPDALLNGDSLVHIISSCVPEVANVRNLLAPDIEAILLGIFYSSYGPNLKFESKCPKCGEVNKLELAIRGILDRTETVPYPAFVEIDMGIMDNIPTKLQIFVKPYTFETNTKQQLTAFEHNKILEVMSRDNADDETKLKVFNECFEKIVRIKMDNVVSCITNIVIYEDINNEIKETNITSEAEILDFVQNADNTSINPIIAKVDELTKIGIPNTYDIECDNDKYKDPITSEITSCNHKWEAQLDFNPTNFFVRG